MESAELSILPNVVKENLSGSLLIVITNTGFKIMWILLRTNVNKSMVLSVKNQVKYQDKKAGVVF